MVSDESAMIWCQTNWSNLPFHYYRIPTYDEIVEEGFSDEEAQLEKEEAFERKYNFRFEQPDEDFVSVLGCMVCLLIIYNGINSMEANPPRSRDLGGLA